VHVFFFRLKSQVSFHNSISGENVLHATLLNDWVQSTKHVTIKAMPDFLLSQ